jgi:transposase
MAGQKPITSIAENALRMVSLGRKSRLALLALTTSGEPGAALLYSLIGTCKLNGVDQATTCVLNNVIADWPINRVSELLPWRVALPTE